MGDLDVYQGKRRFEQTPEPKGQTSQEKREAASAPPRFVVQEHHARRLHWDFRLEHDGVLVSWALPRGVPSDPKRNHLAVHVEDHPLDYIDFQGEIPRGQYGAGSVKVWDEGTYEAHKWDMNGRKPEVMVTLHGRRLQGRYVLFQTGGKNWMIHRMDPAPAPDPDPEPVPGSIRPMLARLGHGLPEPDDGYAFEFKWDGIRAIVFIQPAGVRIQSRSGEDITGRYPELGHLVGAIGGRTAILDGEIVALDERGVPRFEQLQQRIGLTAEADIRQATRAVPVIFMAFDVLYLDGDDTMRQPYLERRQLLMGLGLQGPNWQAPEHQLGGGQDMLTAASQNGLEGVVAKRTDSLYEPGRRSGAWVKVKHRWRQELVIGGWQEGEGRRRGLVGALLVGYWEGSDFVYAGKVGTGFSDAMLRQLHDMLAPLSRSQPPFTRGQVPRAAVHFVEPRLVGEFEFSEWTHAGQLRAPTFKGLRSDKDPRQVIRERPS
jgi:bifunctional non-homologous end joining protein LigD